MTAVAIGVVTTLVTLQAVGAAVHTSGAGPSLDPPSPPTGGIPDTFKECQWARETNNVQ